MKQLLLLSLLAVSLQACLNPQEFSAEELQALVDAELEQKSAPTAASKWNAAGKTSKYGPILSSTPSSLCKASSESTAYLPNNHKSPYARQLPKYPTSNPLPPCLNRFSKINRIAAGSIAYVKLLCTFKSVKIP